MKVEIEMEIDEANESAVMEKVSQLIQGAKELGFTIEEIELKREKEGEEDEEKEEKKRKSSKKRKRR